jgi:large subunit ribosomal protein L22
MSKQATQRRQADNEAVAKAKALRTSSQKLNLVVGLIRGLDVGSAMARLDFCRRRIAGEVRKVLESAIANAENNHQLDVDRLYVSEATVGRSFVMRRWRARARGRTARIQKPFSRLTIVVREKEESV